MRTLLTKVIVLSLLVSMQLPALAQEPEATGSELPLPSPRPGDEAADPAMPVAPPKPAERAEPPETAEPDEPAKPAKPKDEPPAAYVPPEKARTVPEDTAPPTPDAGVTPTEATEAAAAVLDAETCEAELRQRGAEFSIEASISEEQCGVLRPVLLKKFSSGATIGPDTRMLCRAALALDIWVAESVTSAVEKELDGEKLAAIAQASTYVCRDRASEKQISEHSRGSAVDISSFEFESGKRIEVTAQAPGSQEDKFLAAIRRAACGPFRTVLGPGTDADHTTHFHLDIAARSNNSTYCR
ncbi:hypothetical protein FPY71_14925 [Aureimonas fodinaquatilis]|uniref:Extensin-like C-terminal domain-containing protein n=1 Tax=Aureimonas fodinaquatilis TaxID=2565783 RepID=A0A5B0DSY0_9HYPH|nr:extensin family protein [Aureimonas fodinaquatilis]KAA0968861.1 hypothetical protein FPY71_14925 [Aureimonas fodinaquatilis]